MLRGDWAVGRPRRVDVDERIRNVRTIFNAPNVDVAPRAAEDGEGELVEGDIGCVDDAPDGGDVDEVLGAPRVVAEVDALETSGGEVVRAERLGEDAGAVAEHHLEVLEGVVARVADGDLDRRDPSWLSVGAPVRL